MHVKPNNENILSQTFQITCRSSLLRAQGWTQSISEASWLDHSNCCKALESHSPATAICLYERCTIICYKIPKGASIHQR